MAASLDFIVFGVPRSGTTGLAAALNLQPDIYCAHERMFANASAEEAQAQLSAWLDATPPAGEARSRQRKHAEVQRIRAAGGRLVLGDKLPGYYLRLAQIEAMHPGLRKLCIVRSAHGFTASWDVRAAKADGVGWQAGRRGLFGIFEMLFAMHALARSRGDTQVLSYEAFFFEHDHLIKRLIGDLAGSEVAPSLRRDFAARFFRQKDSPAPQGGPYDALLARMGVAAIDELLLRRRLVPAAELAETFDDFTRQAWPVALEGTPALLAAMPPAQRAAAAAYGAGWQRTRRRQIASPDATLAAGLAALAELFPA